MLHHAERLDVVDDRRTHVEAEHGREIGGLDARIGPLAFERLDKARLLAADIGARATVDVNLQIVTAAQDVPAEKTLRARLRQRLVQQSRALGHLATNVNVSEMNVVREAREDHALDQLMRVLVENLPVLERSGLGFIRVADEVNRLAALAIHKTPLQPRRKTRAPAAPQTGFHDLVADLLRSRLRLAVRQ